MNKKLPPYEKELLLAHILKKSREYVLAHDEIKLTKMQDTRYKRLLRRRENHEPMAYILGHKEFYSMDFKVTPDTLIPRPETEILVELVTQNVEHEMWNTKCGTIIDVGTGSGNIIISIAKNIHAAWTSDVQMRKGHRMSFYATDIFRKALTVARHNAKKHDVDKQIKFLKGSLLSPILNTKYKIQNTIIVANLPYLSQKIYNEAMPDVKNFEPKSALLSDNNGLRHYEELFRQIKILDTRYKILNTIIEFSPEQKPMLQKLIKKHFPTARPEFHKDLAGKWRVAELGIP